MSFDATQHPHRRYDPLGGKWVLVSPHRALRPWQGQQDAPARAIATSYDAGCYLCPGNTRANGAVNPDYAGAFVFDNDFAALDASTPVPSRTDPLWRSEGVSGECRVVCFSPDHSRTLPQMCAAEIEAVVACWCDESAALGAHYPSVQVFENKGAMMGCSNPHPHGQIWASSSLPDLVAREDANQRDWLAEHDAPLLLQLAEREASEGVRVVCSNVDWLSVVPWWASWPFETLILPRFPVQRLPDLAEPQRTSLAAMIKDVTTRYDNLFATSFPYSMGWHGAPFGTQDIAHWQLHAHVYPPLLRSASVRKFMVGYELLAEAQRDLTPEQAAERLRAQSTERFAA